jgi:hypothetical protein
MTEPAEPAEPADLGQHEVRPVDQERLVAWLKRANQRYFVSSEGAVGGVWSGALFTFAIAGKGGVLQIRGQLTRPIALERREELIAMINERHGRTAWPKCSLMVLDDGSMRLAADTASSIAHGMSERQLDRAIRTGLSAALSAFAELNARYPDPLATAPEGLA